VRKNGGPVACLAAVELGIPDRDHLGTGLAGAAAAVPVGMVPVARALAGFVEELVARVHEEDEDELRGTAAAGSAPHHRAEHDETGTAVRIMGLFPRLMHGQR
jgi:hypothetical protein